MMETELYFTYSLFCMAPYFVESKILPTVLYHPKQQNAVISMLGKTMLNCFHLDGQFLRAGYNILKLIHFIAMTVSGLGFTNFFAQEIFTTTLPFISYLPLKNKTY